MGIRGLTTFVQHRSEEFFDDYELHDCNLVIDGNSIACQLYKWHTRTNDCFGGDYDKYAAVIKQLFMLLKECNVTPYVIFDGGYEQKKLSTILDRMKNKIQAAKDLNPVTEGSVSVFPLFLREAFISVVKELNIACVMCDFEGDSESACLARSLNCPVISFDSDYYIFDVQYIPFSNFEMNLRVSKNGYKYICCKIYRIEKFLDYFGGLDKKNLPLLAVLLGNDYVKKSFFKEFYQHLKVQKTNRLQNEQQRNIKSVIVWLQNETPESALTKVLSRYKLDKRKKIADKIESSLKGYNTLNTIYTKYLNLNFANKVKSEDDSLNIDLNAIEDCSGDLEDLETSEEENVDFGKYDDELRHKLPKEFLEKFRNCQFPPSFMDIVVQHKYYCIPQIEDYSLTPSHLISFKIVAAIHKILCGDTAEKFKCIARCESTVKFYEAPVIELKLPNYSEVQTMDQSSRQKLLLNILGIEDCFIEDCLKHFPESWHVMLISLKYKSIQSKFDNYYVYAIILCALLLNYVDTQIGKFRSSKAFDSKFHQIIQNLKHNNSNTTPATSINQSLTNINREDAIFCMNDVIHLFQMSLQLKSSIRYFRSHIVHELAEFQSCLIHIYYLNNLLNHPFEKFLVYKFYDGTFLYNAVANFKRRTKLDDYIQILLKSAPSLLNSYVLMMENLNKSILTSEKAAPPRRKKRKAKKEDVEEDVYEKPEEDEPHIYDSNNRFALLASVE